MTEDETEADCVVNRMSDALEKGDMEAFGACFSTEALIWHNDDEVERGVDEVSATLGYAFSLSTSVRYLDRRIVRTGNLYFVRHVLTAELRSGKTLRLPAMMCIETNADGLITRIEEYYDSRALDVLK